MSYENTEVTTYRNLLTNGCGFVNRIRSVKPAKGEAYVACSVRLEEGPVSGSDYSQLQSTYVDCRVVGEQALGLIRQHFTGEEGICQPSAPVRAGVRLAGLTVKPFLYQEGDKAGQPGASLYARLIKIDWMAVGGSRIDIPGDQPQQETEQAE